jgi:hypothetical protein
MFDGYAGTSASGFAAEVATEEAVLKLLTRSGESMLINATVRRSVSFGRA